MNVKGNDYVLIDEYVYPDEIGVQNSVVCCQGSAD